MSAPVPGFVPLNHLEQALLDTQEALMSPAAFFQQLVEATVFILINQEIPEGGTWRHDTGILVLNSLSGFPVVAVFCAPERSVPWLGQAPDYKHGLQTNFRWLLQGVTAGVGVVLNPGSPVGVELPPTLVEKLRTSVGIEPERTNG